jgi:hypothetical protein
MCLLNLYAKMSKRGQNEQHYDSADILWSYSVPNFVPCPVQQVVSTYLS